MKNKKTIITCVIVWFFALLLGFQAIELHKSTWYKTYEKWKREVPKVELTNVSVRIVDADTFEIMRACYDKGYQELCVSDLWAIGRIESYNGKVELSANSNGTVDSGYFHINSIHKVPLKCLADIYCSATWVIEKLEQHGYPEDRINAIGKYHSKTPHIKARYINNISRYLTIK